jgi:hypothetical protein
MVRVSVRAMRAAVSAVLVVMVANAGVAYGDQPVVPDGQPQPPPRRHHVLDTGYSHYGQLGVSLRGADGLRGIATYHSTDYCGTTSTDSDNGLSPLCVTRSPFALELEVAYGAGHHLDVLAEIKFGLEHDFGSAPSITDGPRPFLLAPGIRYYFSESHSSKLFTTAQAVFDFTGYQDVNGTSRGTDFGVRNLNGVWFDVHPKFGFYIFAGETLTISRWLDFELEAGVGFQARYP